MRAGRRRWTVAEKIALVRTAKRAGKSVSAVCREAGVSRDTLYRWSRAYGSSGKAGLRPARPPSLFSLRVDDEIVAAVIDLTLEHPAWGKARVARAVPPEIGDVSPTGVRLIWTDVDGRSVTSRRARQAWAKAVHLAEKTTEELRREEWWRKLNERVSKRERLQLRRLRVKASPSRRRASRGRRASLGS